MRSQRQIKLLESLRDDNGNMPGPLKDLADKLKRYSYSDFELDFIEKELAKTSTWKRLLEKRGNDL